MAVRDLTALPDSMVHGTVENAKTACSTAHRTRFDAVRSLAFLLLTEGSRCILSVTERSSAREPTVRSRPGNTGPPDPEDSGHRTSARLGHRTATEAGVWRHPPSERRLAVPRAAQTRAPRLDQGGVAAE